MNLNKDFGKYGEDLACSYLINKGYKIIDRNFYCKQGEIDIIAISKFNELVFVEVKTRRNLRYGMPCEAVTSRKKRHIVASSNYYILLKGFYNICVRYDVVEVLNYGSRFYFNHIQDAF